MHSAPLTSHRLGKSVKLCFCSLCAGVSALLTVALDGARDPAQLQMVEFGRGFGYKLPLSIGMMSVGSSVLKQIVSLSSEK